MKSKRLLKKIISAVLIFTMLFTNMVSGHGKNAEAAVSSGELAKKYLNASSVYLNFANKDTITFDFNINNEAKKKGAQYAWYVKGDKGEPDAVSINKLTGVVTAKKAGTAYIRCKITLPDKTIVRPEAKVIVINNISKVDISNMPKDQTIQAGQKTDFNRVILNTDAGKNIVTKGVSRWELKEDMAGVGSISDMGVVLPTKAGSFSIRSVCFQSIQKYNLWLKDKAKYKNYITASSKWYTVTVEDFDAETIVTNQKELDQALASGKTTQITLSTDSSLNIIIAKGSYLDKTLIVNAPNAEIENYAVFKNVEIRAIKENTWIENANGNAFRVTSIKVRIIVNGQAEVKEITFDREDSTVYLEVEGKIHKITVLQPSEFHMSGEGEEIPITIEETAEGSSITSSIPLNLECTENTKLVLNPGSEGTKINRSNSSTQLTIENNTNQSVTITTNHSDSTIVEAGKKEVIGGGIQPAPPVSIPNTNVSVEAVSISPETMNLTAGGTTGTLIVAVTPENASNKLVTWTSSNEAIATVANGIVTPLAAGTTTITVKTADGNKTAACVVTVVLPDLSMVGLNVLAGMITGTTAAMEYSINSTNGSDGTWLTCADNSTAVSFVEGKVYVRAKAQPSSFRLVDTLTVSEAPALIYDDVANTMTGLNDTYEYRIDSNEWTSGEVIGDFSGDKTVEVRLKVTETALPSRIQTILFTENLELTGVGINVAAGTITGTTGEMQYSLDSTNGSGGSWTDCSEGNTAASFTAGKVYIRAKIQPENFRLVAVLTVPETPALASDDLYNSITGMNDTYEYRIDSGEWISGAIPGDFSGDKIVEVRLKATADALPSEVQTITFTQNLDLTEVDIDVAAGIITGTSTQMQYSIDSSNGSDGTWNDCNDGNSTVSFTAGRIYIRAKVQPGNIRLIATLTVPDAPVSGVTYDVAAGTISGLGSTYEYSINNGVWSTTTSEVAFVAGDITVRTKATENELPSEVEMIGTIVVPEAPVLVFDDVVNNIIGLDDTYEYRIDSGEWVSGEFAGDFSGNKTINIRWKATADTLPSLSQVITFTLNLDLSGVGINIADGIITGTTSEMQYSLNSTNGTNGEWEDCSSGDTEVVFTEGTIYIRAKVQPSNFRWLAALSAPEAPLLSYDDITNTILDLDNTYEYCIDSGEWISGDIPGDFSGDKMVQVRWKATADLLPSRSQIITFTQNLDLSGVSVNVAAGTITGTTEMMQYSLDSSNGLDGSWSDCSDSSTDVSFSEGKVYIRAKIQPGNFSLVATLSIPEAPALVSDDVANTIIGLNDDYEYRIETGEWISGDILGDYTGNKSVEVRVKATSSSLPSMIQSLSFHSDPLIGVMIEGGNQVGSVLAAIVLPFDASDSVSYQWLVGYGPTGPFVPNPISMSGTYTLTASDAGKYIKVSVQSIDDKYTGALESNPIYINVPVSGVFLDQDTVTLTAGGAAVALTVAVMPSEASDKSVIWTSSDETVATVSNGTVTPIAAGTADITVTTVDRGYTATCTVTVNPDLTPADSTSGITTWVHGDQGSKRVILTIAVRNVAGDNIGGLLATDFSVRVKNGEIVEAAVDFNSSWFSDFTQNEDGTYSVVFNGESNWKAYYLIDFKAKGVVIESPNYYLYTPAGVPPLLLDAVVSNDGTIITLSFDKAMFEPHYVDGLPIKINGINREFSYGKLRTDDNTKIDYTLSGSPVIFAGDTVTISLTYYCVNSADSGMLQLFDDKPVTNNSTVSAGINSVSPTVLNEEVSLNCGSLSNGTIVVTIENGILANPLLKEDVTAANLPSGMDYTVTRDSDTQLTINITGSAIAHENVNDVNNLTFTIAREKVTSAITDLTTTNIYIDFVNTCLTPVIDIPVSATSVNIWDSVSLSELSGAFKASYSDATPVTGTLAWEDETLIVNETGEFNWIFTPDNSEVYNEVKGRVYVYVNSAVADNAIYDLFVNTTLDIPVNFNGNTITSVSDGISILTEGVDYIVTDNCVTLSEQYMKTKMEGNLSITFCFSAGVDDICVITLIDTATYAISMNTVSPVVIGGQYGQIEGYNPNSILIREGIYNSGTGYVTGLVASVSGANSTAFTASVDYDQIAPGSSYTTVAVAPIAGLKAGTYTATITITGDHGVSTSFDVRFKVSPIF
jgi:uncharacterized protein YjdB